MLPIGLDAQDLSSPRNQGTALLFKAGYAFQLPAGDLVDRFGNNFSVSSGFDLITGNNLIFGLEGHLSFGSRVKEDVLVNLRTGQGFIIGNNRNPADVQLRQRGLYLGAHVGKLFGLGEKNPRSGIRVTLGAGWMQHKIRIQNDAVTDVAPLNDEYRFGYDRLTHGLAFRQFVGYQILGLKGRLNFYAGVEAFQGLTQGRRDIQFDTQAPYLDSRFDMQLGIRAAIVLPFYFGGNGEEIYY